MYIVLEFILVPFCLMSRRSDKKEKEETKYGDVVPCQFFACLNFTLVVAQPTTSIGEEIFEHSVFQLKNGVHFLDVFERC